MKRITLCTCSYEEKLREFADMIKENGLAEVMDKEAVINNVNLSWKQINSSRFTDALMVLLENVAALENPIYKHSPKLRALADGLRNTPLHQRELARLREFVKTARMLNIEGYITFRMGEYR